MPKTAWLRANHGASTARNATAEPTPQPMLAPPKTRGRHGVQPRRTSQATATPTARKTPSIRDSVARPANAPAATSHGPGRSARIARIEQYSEAAPVAPNTAKLSVVGYMMNSGPAKIASAAASSAVPRDPQISIVTRYVSGTSSAERMTSGTVPATYVGPKTAIDAAETIEVSGIQCAFDGIGSTAGSGRTLPTSMKLHITGVVKPWPSARRWAIIE